jgi:hypothetical protein
MNDQYVGVMELVNALRAFQREYRVDVIAATYALRRPSEGLAKGDLVTLRINGVESPICEVEDDQGRVFTFPLVGDDAS